MTTHEKISGIIFDIEDYVGGNIEGVEDVDRMAFTVFLRENLTSLINQARKEAAIEELERLKHFDSFNEPYTWQGDERPGKLVDIRIKALKESKDA